MLPAKTTTTTTPWSLRMILSFCVLSRVLSGPLFLFGLHLPGRALGFGHHPQDILAQDLADVGFRITSAQSLLGDFRQFRAILHALRHHCAVEIRAQTDV